MKDLGRIIITVLVTFALGAVGYHLIQGSAGYFVHNSKALNLEAPKVKDYKIILSDGTALLLKGTRIDSSGGFCSEVWLGNVLDTLICQPHIITEVPPEGQEASHGRS